MFCEMKSRMLVRLIVSLMVFSMLRCLGEWSMFLGMMMSMSMSLMMLSVVVS